MPTCLRTSEASLLPCNTFLAASAGRLFGELDYIQEGKNAERFEVNLRILLSC